MGKVYLFIRAAVTKCHRLSSLNRLSFLPTSGGHKSEMEMSAGMISPEALVLGIDDLLLSVSSYHLPCACLCPNHLFF